jgi:hypothetical protein
MIERPPSRANGFVIPRPMPCRWPDDHADFVGKKHFPTFSHSFFKCDAHEFTIAMRNADFGALHVFL